MQDTNRRSSSDAQKCFDFLNSETPASIDWVRRYLSGKLIVLPNNGFNMTMEDIKQYLADVMFRYPMNNAESRQFARTMSSAWRVRKSRQKKNAGTLSLTLDNSVLRQLKQMCNGETKAEILTKLINGGYEAFLASKQAQKANKQAQEAKKAEEQQILQMSLKHKKLDALIKRTSATAGDSQAIREFQAQNDDLRQCIAKLYDLIYSANERGQSIDDALLIKATKVCYSAFSETNNQ
ncbi:hypothetical protein VXM60_01705 [Shewanella khirikhana]|uniref:hypothetical protein n=1 Tax=Shewanella khirikhana TaxID=1965282 RepID=UPI0030D2ABFB